MGDTQDPLTYSRNPIVESAWRSLLLRLAGLLSNDQESITLSYLLDLASNHPYSFKCSKPQSVRALIELGRKELTEIDEIEQKLRSERDRKLAHLDRKLINEPDSFTEISVDFEETSQALQTAEQIVSRFFLAFHGEKVDFSELRNLFTFQFEQTSSTQGE